MKPTTHFLIVIFACFTGMGLYSCTPAGDSLPEGAYDVVIYGGTSAAMTAAIQTKKMGKSVVVVCPEAHLGGLTAGGLGWTDSGKQHAIGGLSREFYGRIWQVYSDTTMWRQEARAEYGNYGQGGRAIDEKTQTMWTFEPKVAEETYEAWIKEHNIPVFRNQWLDRANGVEKVDGKIRSITMESGEQYYGRAFIDATYEGDLMATAGVSFIVGRESNDQYIETLNGVQTANAKKHQFTMPIDPYVVEGDPASGLLPRISNIAPGPDGSADKGLQAYCYRMCLTQVPENRIPFTQPEGYDASQYVLIARVLAAGWREVFHKFDPIPNKKTDTNNHGPFSTDNIGMNYDYPEATYARRQEILAEHQQYQRGWLYFLANDPSIPEDVRTEMSKWGLAKDEFTDNGNWPHQIYVREARRMVSDFVVNERHLKREIPTPRSIGMGSYNMDSHNIRRYVDSEGHVKNEGDVQINPGGPYPIDYGAIIPKQAECSNLLVPVCVSTSHIAYGSIRMEPVFMILGQSAATAACMAIDAKQAVQEVPYEQLKARLLEDGQVLEVE